MLYFIQGLCIVVEEISQLCILLLPATRKGALVQFDSLSQVIDRFLQVPDLPLTVASLEVRLSGVRITTVYSLRKVPDCLLMPAHFHHHQTSRVPIVTLAGV